MSLSARYAAEQSSPETRRARKKKKRKSGADRPLRVAELEALGFKIARRVFAGHADAFARKHGLVPEKETYDPARDVACQQLRVPYGKVGRGGRDGNTQEIVLEAPAPINRAERRRDCLLSAPQMAQQREAYDRNRAWMVAPAEGAK